MNFLYKVFVNFLTVTMLVLIGVLIFFQIQIRKNPVKALEKIKYRPITVSSGSMKPAFEPGDLIIVKRINPTEVKLGDIITFKIDNRSLVTHRVVRIVKENGELMFRTRGDANNSEDRQLVSQQQLIGKLVFKIRYGGYIANFISSRMGFFIVICIPTILLILDEILYLFKLRKKGLKLSQK